MNRYQSLAVMTAALLAGSVTLAAAECGNLGKAAPGKAMSGAYNTDSIAISSASKKAKKSGMKCTPEHKKAGHC